MKKALSPQGEAVDREVDHTAKRNAEVIPVALEIFSRIATRDDLKIGDSVTLGIDEAVAYYQDVYRQEVVPTLLAANIQLNAVKFLFETVLIPIERLGDTFNSIGHDTEAIPLAKAILACLGKHTDLKTDSMDKPAVVAYYKKIYEEEIMPLIAESKVSTVSYVFSLLRQPFQFLTDLTISSLEMNKEMADSIKWGVKDMGEVRIQDLDTALKNSGKKPADAGAVDKSKTEKKK